MLENNTLEIVNPNDRVPFSKEAVLNDFRICCISREASLMGRREVLTGKAKFGIFGGGKEVAQVAMAYAFRRGDFRSGYYRDQTLMFALGLSTLEQFFAQLYADADNDPFSGGRQMNNHFATPLADQDGNWLKHTEAFNITSDTSNTGGQMARALGLALASKHYRLNPELAKSNHFSNAGDEVCFCTIGDASTSEGVFWETVNAAGVMEVPLAIFVWDDGYGISVPTEYQTTKGSISDALEGFRKEDDRGGINILKVPGWDYASMLDLFIREVEKVRQQHLPAVFHVNEMTQPQGHSTSGSHERYKSKKRLEWEKNNDCILQMEKWMIREGFATASECQQIRFEAKKRVRQARDNAWEAFIRPIKHKTKKLKELYQRIPGEEDLKEELQGLLYPSIDEVLRNARRMSYRLLGGSSRVRPELQAWMDEIKKAGPQYYHSFLHSESAKSALEVPVVPPAYSSASPLKNGYQILNSFFSVKLEELPELCAFGEDVGTIGDVNQGFAGLQKAYGKQRVFDTGIREWTIIGQAIGMAMRGLRPIAEIQYLDYLVYGLEPLTDDLATLRWRSDNVQQAPAIIRTRGHRLEGVWHSGSPMGMIINSLRGIHVCVPRNMTQAAGMYNTLLQSNDPGLVIETLNGYRLKETLPDNIGDMTVPLGVPEILLPGEDVTLVTYGACVQVATEGIKLLEPLGISVELIDVCTLLPFDLQGIIRDSLSKTNRIVFLDEDVPGGATAFMLQQVLEKQDGYSFLDSAPVTLTAKAHRPPYGSAGDYFTKPNAEDVFEIIYKMIQEAEPDRLRGNLFPGLSV